MSSPRLVLPALVLLGLALALVNRFVQDDAFISFVYARNLVEGEGLTWFGERVEGYTNFLWVLWSALGLALGLEPVWWAWLGSLASLAVVVVATYRMARLTGGGPVTAELACLLLVTNYTVSCYGTGGLETMLQTALVTLATVVVLALRSDGERVAERLAVFSTLAALAVLTRLDSAVPVVVLGLLALPRVLAGRRARNLAALAAPFLVLVGGWLAWKLAYYGELLPNTYHAKVGGAGGQAGAGLRYVWGFLRAYWLWPFLVLGLPVLLRDRARLRALGPLALLVLAWLAYVVRVGGDFMEYRFLVPAAPALFVLVAAGVHDGLGALVRRPRLVALASLAALGFASVHHARTFKQPRDFSIDTIRTLGTCYGLYRDGDWSRIGEALGRELRDADPLIALQPVGAIPYHSRLRTVDMWGLNDRWVARHGTILPVFHRPGHLRHVTLAELRRRGVNLVLGHPEPIAPGRLARPRLREDLERWVRAEAVKFDRTPIDEAVLVELPIDERMSLVAWYLTPSDALDRLIAERGWATTVVTPDRRGPREGAR